MGSGGAICAIIFLLAFSFSRGLLAHCRQHRLAVPGTGLGIQRLLRKGPTLFELLSQQSPFAETRTIQWTSPVSNLPGTPPYPPEIGANSNRTGGSLTRFEGTLWDERGASIPPTSLVQLRLSPLDDSALALYHKVFRESIQGTAKPGFNYVLTHSAMRSLAVTNLIIGSLLPEVEKKRAFVRKIGKVVGKNNPKSDAEEEAEIKEVVQVLKQFSGASSARIRSDSSVMSAIQHIICNVREGKRSGFAGLFESLASESIFTIAHSILHTGASLGLSLQPMLTSGLRLVQGCVKMAMKIQTMAGPALLLPGGVVGTVLQHFLRAFNLIFFPPLLAVTGGLAGAMGVACLLGVPTVLSEIYNFVSTKVLRGVTAVYKHTQLFRLRSDPHGVKILKSAFSGKFVSMLTQLWQLDSVGVETLENSVPHMTTFASEVFSQGFLNGIVHFAREYTSLIEEEYLTGYEDATAKCYEQGVLLTETKLTCEGTFRRLEAFSTRSKAVLNFISWMAFRDYITELLLMVYNTARLSLEAQINRSENPSMETLRAAFAAIDLQDSLVANIVVKPRLQRDVHNFTSGVVGITTFFLLRKLHRWRPWPAEKAPTVSTTVLGAAAQQQSGEGKREDLSLVTQRLEALAEVEMPPELAMAAPELKIVEDKPVTSTEATLLGTYAVKRDQLMMSLLRRSLQKLIGALDSLFGRLEKMVKATIGRDRVHTCKLADRKLCFNTDEATKARFAVLQFVLAAHLGVSIGTDEKLVESPQDLKDDFMLFVKDAAWFRYRSRTLGGLRRRTRWGLDILVDHLFPQRKEEDKKEDPVSKEHLTTIELAVTSNQVAASRAVRKLFKLTRLQCLNNGALFVLTTDSGNTKVFRPEPPITLEMQKKLCTPEHEFIKFSATYKQEDVGGHLLVPGHADINGFMVDSGIILRAKHNDESAAYLIEAALWAKGIPRIDALMAADLLVATKRMLYTDRSWEEFFNDWTPTDLDYVQHHLSSGMHLDREKYVVEERKALYSLDLSADGLLELLVRSLESTFITAGSLNAGLSDLALIFPATVGLEALNMAEKNVTGLTSMLGRFQVLLWDEYAAKKQRSKTTPVLYHLQSSVDSAAPPQLARNGFLRPSISDAFAHEEGTTDPLYADWCEELYSQASNSLDEPGAANLAAQDAGTIQCALLRFLGKRQQGEPTEKEKNAVFKYLHNVTELLRKAKKTNRYSWKRYLNAKPPRKGENREQADSFRAAIKRSLVTLKKRASRSSGRMAHKIRSEAAKRFFGIRVFNILRGSEFLRTLHLAAVEAFADQALFPSRVLLHPTTLAAFTRIRTLMKFEVVPMMGRPGGAEVITQIKMMPTPSPAMRRLIKRLEAQLKTAKTKFGSSYRRHIRHCAGYLSLINIASSAPAFVGSHLPRLFSRFVSLVDQPTSASRGEYLITRRSLAYLEQAGMKLVLKAGDAVALLEKSSMDPPVELPVHRTLGLLSNIAPESLPLATAGRKLHHPRLGRASLLLFCSLAIPALANPNHERRREAALKQMEELREVLTTAELPLYFQIDQEATSSELDFHDFESLISAAKNVQPRREDSRQTELTAGFLLHAPLMKALEIMGLVTETVGDDFIASPLQCTPEDKSSGTSYTIPVNGASRLRMITSMLTQLGDAEDVMERLEASNMAAVSTREGSTENFVTTTAYTEEPTQSSAHDGSSEEFEEQSQTKNMQMPEQTESYGNASFEKTDTSTQELTADSEQWTDPLQFNVNTAHSGTSSASSELEGREPVRKYAGDHALEMAIKADEEGLRNAKAAVQHFTQQLSLFEAHSSAFTSIFHTIVSVAQLPSRLFNSVSTRFVDHLATAVLSMPWKTQRRWVQRLRRLDRNKLSRKQALRRPVDEGRAIYVATEASGKRTPFSTLFLPSSVKEALNDIRKKWKRLLRTEYLAVRSAACKQDADLWLKDELEARDQAFAEAAEKGEAANPVAAPEQFEKNHEARQQLCVHPLWLELRSRLLVEQDMLEAERLFSYFVRMGIENAKLVQRSADQALVDHLWDQLVEMRLLGITASSEASAAARGRLQKAVERVSKKRPFMAIETVRELVTGFLEQLLQTPNMAKEGLHEKLEQLQIRAVQLAATFLLSKAAGAEQDDAEEAIRNLVRTQMTEEVTSEFTPGEGPGVSNLQAWLVQMYFFADPLSLLSRPSIFKPAVVLIEILNKAAHPRSPVYTIWRKALKSTRQLGSASLELLLRLPRAYVRYPQKTE